MRLAFELVDSVKQIALSYVGGPHPVSSGPEQGGSFCFLFPGQLLELGHLIFSHPQISSYTTDFSGSQAF